MQNAVLFFGRLLILEDGIVYMKNCKSRSDGRAPEFLKSPRR